MARIAAPDIVTLQEVTFKQKDAFRERLAGMGLKEVYYSGRPDVVRMRYGNIIASRWPLDAVELRYPQKELPRPQALAQVSVTVDGRSIVVITAHIPNGASYGWKKIDTFLVLKNLVQRAKGRPCIVTGDFNEPQFEMQTAISSHGGRSRTVEAAFSLWPAGGLQRTHRHRSRVGRRGSMDIREERATACILGSSRARRDGCLPRVVGPELLDRPHVCV